MVTAAELFHDLPLALFLYVLRGDGKVGGAGCFPGSGETGRRVLGLVDEDEVIVNHPVFDLFSSVVEVLISSAWRVGIEVSENERVLIVQG